MSWVAVGVAGASAVVGGQNAKAQNKAKERQNMAAATQTEMSPWTKMGPGQIDTNMKDAGATAIQGGLGGFMQGQAINRGMDAKAAKVGEADVAGAGQGNPLEGNSAMNTNDPMGAVDANDPYDPYAQQRKKPRYSNMA